MSVSSKPKKTKVKRASTKRSAAQLGAPQSAQTSLRVSQTSNNTNGHSVSNDASPPPPRKVQKTHMSQPLRIPVKVPTQVPIKVQSRAAPLGHIAQTRPIVPIARSRAAVAPPGYVQKPLMNPTQRIQTTAATGVPMRGVPPPMVTPMFSAPGFAPPMGSIVKL